MGLFQSFFFLFFMSTCVLLTCNQSKHKYCAQCRLFYIWNWLVWTWDNQLLCRSVTMAEIFSLSTKLFFFFIRALQTCFFTKFRLFFLMRNWPFKSPLCDQFIQMPIGSLLRHLRSRCEADRSSHQLAAWLPRWSARPISDISNKNNVL